MQANGVAKAEADYIPPPIRKHTLRELQQRYPEQKPYVIDGLLREGETCNLIAAPKVGKSWFVYYVALSVVMGWSLFSRFCTAAGKVLIVDNELHPETLSYRIPVVADAMSIDPFGGNDIYLDDLEVWPLRGDLRSLNELVFEFDTIEHGEYKLIIFDAKYRFAAEGTSENDNAAEARFYNQVDRIAAQTGAAVLLVHHSSKGNQGVKSVVDVGAGAGSQSRAVDCHAILREHEEPGHIVFDAVARSYAAPSPLVLKWEWPLWHHAEDMNPEALAGTKSKGEEAEKRRDAEGIKKIEKTLKAGKRATRSNLRTKTGMGADRTNKLIAKMLDEGSLESETVEIRGNETEQFWLSETIE